MHSLSYVILCRQAVSVESADTSCNGRELSLITNREVAAHSVCVAVDGIGESSALLIKAVPDFYRRYAKSKMQNGSFVNSLEDIGKYLMPFFAGVNVEVMYLLLLDGPPYNCLRKNDGRLGKYGGAERARNSCGCFEI